MKVKCQKCKRNITSSYHRIGCGYNNPKPDSFLEGFVAGSAAEFVMDALLDGINRKPDDDFSGGGGDFGGGGSSGDD